MIYADFIARKIETATLDGPALHDDDLHPMLHPFQREIVRWAVQKRRAAIWADTGLGKTVMQIEWARHSGRTVLVVAPLAVCHQTVREAARLGVTAGYVREPEQVTGAGVWVTNYEMVPGFPADLFDAVVLDEASILKQSTGKTRTMLIDHFRDVPARLSCTATPAPNDPEELTNQAEFLGHSTRANMLAAYFVHDDEGWRLKGHARQPFMRWLSSWAVALRRPSDLGYDDAGYDLPGLTITPHLLPVPIEADGQLFATDLGGVGGRSAVRKQTLEARCKRAADLVLSEPDEPWLIWCGTNDEADRMAEYVDGHNVHGAMSPEDKAAGLSGFTDGTILRLITKPQIAAFGLNWQHCARMVFVGLSDSYETYYQSIRRCYRYGQQRVVEAHIVLSEIESQIADNIARKERDASAITTSLVTEMRAVRAEQESAS